MLAAALACIQSIPAAAGENSVPEGLSTSDWTSIRAAYEANRHAAFAVEGGYQARNPGQQWQTHFDGRGFLTNPDAGGWTWGLELVSYGREGAEVEVASPTCIDAQGQRVEYQWDENVTEWYINDRRGLEHGYTVQERPIGDAGPLRFTLAVRGGVRPRVSHNGRDVTFISKSSAAVVNYADLTVFDADGVNVPAWFEPAGRGLGLSIDDAVARYPLTIDPIAQQAYLKASNTGADDQFGYAVGVSGDTVAIGAPGEDSNATGVNDNQADNSAPDSGATYVFVRSGGVWSQQAYLKASTPDEYDGFGWSVAVSGDTVVVGATGEDSSATGVDGNQADNGAPGSGAAYVFVRNDGVWSQQAYLKASNTGAFHAFGHSLAVTADTVVVGAYGEDSIAMDSGAAYVFVRSGGVWIQQGYLKASNTGAGDSFGGSVAASGDTVVVGALLEDSSATGVNGNQGDNSVSDSGAAYIFVRNGGVWSQHAYLKASNTGADDYFGGSVAVSGDTVLVGALQESSSATGVNGNQALNSAGNSGAAYVFASSGGVWSQQGYLKASNTGASDSFGWSVAVSGDTVVVGAPFEDSSATGIDGNQGDNNPGDSGAAYVFVRSAVTWSQQAYLKASNTGGFDDFGLSVAVSGNTVVVGASLEDSSATGVNGNQANNGAGQSGAAYVFAIVPCEVRGDLDADLDIDLDDLSLFVDCLAGPDAANPACDPDVFDGADFDADGDIDLADFAEFQLIFGQSCL